MKIKSGFVSNSSTCSFVVAGWKTALAWSALAVMFEVDYSEKDDYGIDELLNHEYIHIYGDDVFLGVELVRGDENGDLDKTKISLVKMMEKLVKVADIANILDLNPRSASIYTGVYCC